MYTSVTPIDLSNVNYLTTTGSGTECAAFCQEVKTCFHFVFDEKNDCYSAEYMGGDDETCHFTTS